MFVFMHIKNSHGFTLISVLLVLSIIFLSLPFIVQLIKLVSYETTYDELSKQHFFLFLRDELFTASDYKVYSDEIVLKLTYNNEAQIMQYGNNIIRRASGGFDVFLRDIEEVRFERLPYGVRTLITSLEGEQYEKTIKFYE